MMALVVSYEKINKDAHKLVMGSQVMNDIVVDATDIPPEGQAGTSAKLLGSACLNCYVGTFEEAMEARGAIIESLQGQATILKGKDEFGRTRISSIEILVKVGIDDSYLPQFEKCRKIMKRGCLITYSIEPSIKVTYDIQRVQ
jgi:organic hydroperoxide reductase OsmC/OhrA